MLQVIKLVNNTYQISEKNICFVNTAIQLLYAIPKMKTFFGMKEYKLSTESKRQMKICDELSRLFNCQGSFTASAGELRRLVATHSGREYLFAGTQQDTVEFLITLLQLVEAEISEDNWEAKTVIKEFWGVEKHERKFLNKIGGVCSKCKTGPTDEVQKFQVLQVDIPDTSRVIKLNAVLQNYFSENSADAKMKCECCTHKSNCPGTGVCKPKGFASKTILVKSPDTLIVQLNRYLDKSGSKNTTTIWPDDNIQLPSGDEYALCGIGHHFGEYSNSGHYMASVRIDQEWIRCNDTQIVKSDESSSKSMECYVCIYTKVITPGTPFIPTDEWQQLKGRQAPGGLHYSFGINGNYARNMNLSKDITPEKQISPNKKATGEKPPATTIQVETDNESPIDDFLDDDGWITPKSKRKLNKRVIESQVMPNKILRMQEESKEEKCQSCGKSFKLLFSHLSRSKPCQQKYDMNKLRDENKAKRSIQKQNQ